MSAIAYQLDTPTRQLLRIANGVLVCGYSHGVRIPAPRDQRFRMDVTEVSDLA